VVSDNVTVMMRHYSDQNGRSCRALLNWISSLSWWGLLSKYIEAFADQQLTTCIECGIEAARAANDTKVRGLRCFADESDTLASLNQCATERDLGSLKRTKYWLKKLVSLINKAKEQHEQAPCFVELKARNVIIEIQVRRSKSGLMPC